MPHQEATAHTIILPEMLVRMISHATRTKSHSHTPKWTPTIVIPKLLYRHVKRLLRQISFDVSFITVMDGLSHISAIIGGIIEKNPDCRSDSLARCVESILHADQRGKSTLINKDVDLSTTTLIGYPSKESDVC
jgi:hypothetical protein